MRPGSVFSSIAKTDWLTGKFVQWHPENGESCPCEPVFVARPGAGEENDGVVLTIIVKKKGTHSILVALDWKELIRCCQGCYAPGVWHWAAWAIH